MIKKIVFSLVLGLLPALVLAAGSGAHMIHSRHDVSDTESLKRGAQIFVDYCMGCHSAEYMRYNRIQKDTGMTEKELRGLISTRNEKGEPTKPGELMKISMDDEFAISAFGTPVPDLSLIARSRGADWVNTYLRTFYVDDSRPSGMNNLVFSDVAMPHVFWSLQGLQKPVYNTVVRDGVEFEVISSLEKITEGTMSEQEYHVFVMDLVNFMVYLSEPVQSERKSLGFNVLIFIVVFFVFAVLLKKEYWKDIH